MRAKQAVAAAALLVVMGHGRAALGQRALGLDVSAHQGNISQSTWNSIFSVDNRQFVFIRSSRGGTSGEDHRQGGYPSGNNTFFNLSQRYDDPYFVQNINRATNAGLMTGPYHFARLDVIASTTNSGGIANNGTDEANHFIEMAGAWMRPGYLMPTFDLESGQPQRTSNEIAQFSIDFSNRIYAAMGIRPAMYINGNYSNILQGATSTLREQLAQPTGPQPSMVSPGYSMLWNARYATNPNIQTDNPKDTASTFYGPWDDYGFEFHPWDFWQYTSSGSVTGISPVDLNVSHGDIEYVKDFLVPAVWMSDSSGDWSTLSNWNSGQAVVAPPNPAGQLVPYASGPLPTPRLPGAAGLSVTDGQHDTVILERPNANITVTLSSGAHNVRKLYVREALNITGGSLTVNYDPDYAVPTDGFGSPLYPYALRSGPNSAQFSAPVALSGTGALNVTALQVDAGQTFTVAGGTLSFRNINLMSGYPEAARMVLSSDLNVNPASVGGVASIGSDYYFGYSGQLDLGGGDRTINVAGGELRVGAPITNGALTKSGPGTMRLDGYSDFAGGTTVTGGTLLVNSNAGFGGVMVTGPGARLGGYGYVASDAVVNNGGTIAPGEGHGSLYVGSNTTLNAGSTLEYEFDPANSVYDTLNVGGNVTLTGNPSLNLVSPLNTLLPRNSRYAIVSYNGAWNGGSFAGYDNNSVFNLGGNTFRIQYDDNIENTQNYSYFYNAITLTSLSGPVAGFVDEYAHENWTTDDANAHGGYIYTDGGSSYLTIVGPEDHSRLPGEIGYSIEIPADGTLSFDWYFTNYDLPGYDFAYFINGVETSLASTDGESGHVEVTVSAGDLLGWRVSSVDSVGGPGVLTISNFFAPGVPISVPEPGTSTFVGLTLALLTRQRLRRRRIAP